MELIAAAAAAGVVGRGRPLGGSDGGGVHAACISSHKWQAPPAPEYAPLGGCNRGPVKISDTTQCSGLGGWQLSKRRCVPGFSIAGNCLIAAKGFSEKRSRSQIACVSALTTRANTSACSAR